MKVLVTGAGGFVGRQLVEYLTATGHSVTALLGPDDAPLRWSAVQVQHGDVRETAVLARAVTGVDALIHAAGPPTVSASFEDPAGFASVHVAGTATALQAAARAGLRSVVYISSAEVYGNETGERVFEHDPCHPVSPYGAAKLGAEWMARTVALPAKLPLTILRPFSLYGPGQRANSLLGTILAQVAVGGPIELRDLAPVRDYLHIEDLCRMAAAALAPAAPLRILNACSEVGVSVEALATIALAAAGRRAEIRQLGGNRPTDMNRLIGSRLAAREALGWEPEITLHEGLRRMMAQ